MARIFIFFCFFALLSGCGTTDIQENPPLAPPCFDTLYPVIYNCTPADNGDYAFRTVPAKQRTVKLIPNLETRENMQLKEITGVTGIHQFFLDHDLVSGFVHRYTQNMFDHLRPDDFVLKYKASKTEPFTGEISFIHKSELTAVDTLGKNIGFFRQWRLSEIDHMEKDGETYVKMDTCTYYTRCMCPQSSDSLRPKQIPLWQRGKQGYRPVKELTAFGQENGGTVVLVWETQDGTWFQDIHSSWSEIFQRAVEISKQYKCDPAICISDAGPFARKLKADKNFVIKVPDLDAFTLFGKRFGAGYGYMKAR